MDNPRLLFYLCAASAAVCILCVGLVSIALGSFQKLLRKHEKVLGVAPVESTEEES